MWGSQDGGLFELQVAPLHPRLADPINALVFDSLEEAVWAGNDAVVAQLACPSLERHCSVPSASPIIELRTLGEAAVSLSAYELAVHASGGAQRLTWTDEVRRLGSRQGRGLPCQSCRQCSQQSSHSCATGLCETPATCTAAALGYIFRWKHLDCPAALALLVSSCHCCRSCAAHRLETCQPWSWSRAARGRCWAAAVAAWCCSI
mgnify:CR=1 FL=1